MSLNFDASLVFDKGLSNYMGHNNCFLNSAVQVLWHLDVFRKNFLALKHHYCIQGPCIYCSLQDIFKEFNESAEDVLHPDMLRVTLATVFQDQLKFQLGEVDDASECYENILLRIHFHLTNGVEDDSCLLKHCITHNKFAMSLIQQTECDCGSTSEPFPFMQLVHFISTSSVVKFSSIKKTKNFGEILKLAFGSGQSSRSCSPNCQYASHVNHTLVNLPDVVNIGLIWESDQSDPSHIKQFVSTIQTSVNLEDLFDKVLEGNGNSKRELVGVVCYYMKHYSTFFFHSKKKTWISFDDASVNEIGKDWSNVVDKCCKGRYQPLLLIYQNPNAELIDILTAPPKTTHINNDFECMKSFRNKCSSNSSGLLSLNHLHDKDPTPIKYLNKYSQPQTSLRDLTLKHSNESLCRPSTHKYKHPVQEKDFGLMSLSSSCEKLKPEVTYLDTKYLKRVNSNGDYLSETLTAATPCSRVEGEETDSCDSERILLPSWTLISIKDVKDAPTKTSRVPSPMYDNLRDYDCPSINEVCFEEPSKNESSRHRNTKELDDTINRKLIKDKVKAIYR